MSDVPPGFLEFPDSIANLLDSIERLENSFKFPANVLFIGDVGSGKTAFINSSYSTRVGEIIDLSNSGSSPGSLTRIFHCHAISPKINFWDYIGFDNQKGEFDSTKISLAILGHFLSGIRLDQPVNHSSKGFRLVPGEIHKMRVVAGVLPCSEAENEGTLSRLTRLRELLFEKTDGSVRLLIFLTFCDKFDENICDKKPTEGAKAIADSEEIAGLREKVSKLLGVSRSNIIPVWNYEAATEVNRGQDTLNLIALKRILACAAGSFKLSEERKRDENMTHDGCTSQQ